MLYDIKALVDFLEVTLLFVRWGALRNVLINGSPWIPWAMIICTKQHSAVSDSLKINFGPGEKYGPIL